MSAFRNCPRSRWLGWERDGGFSRKGEALALQFGRALHLGLEHLLKGETVEGAASAALSLCPPPHPEQDYLLEGLLRLWAKNRLPAVFDEYEFTMVEQELRWPMGESIIDLLRLDGLLRRRSDGAWFYLEFKSTTTIDDAWIASWEQNAQFLLNIRAIEEVLGLRISGVLIEGLAKGIRDFDRAREMEIQYSPLCYGFTRVDGEGHRIYRPTYAAGHRRIGWWEAGRTPAEVVELLGGEGSKLLGAIPPIRPRAELLQDHHEQAVAQELHVWRGRDELMRAPSRRALNVWFPQNPDHCRRYKRHPCPFLDICYDDQIAQDPLGSGLYEKRVPNHPED